jgi:mRNA-degrading endonuclease RelE of RelBE toxin-antitoxin system
VRPTVWSDWLTESFFRVRASPAAAEKLSQLAPETQQRLRQMIQEITELADLTPPNTGTTWVASGPPQLLTLHLGRVCVRYSISEDTRTLFIQHVILLEEDEASFAGTG